MKQNKLSSKEEDYIFSVGSSNRDYSTLADCVKKVKSKFLIVTRPSAVKGINFPDNIEVKFNIYGEALDELFNKAKIIVIPLNDSTYSAGQLVLLKAMAMAKPIVVSKNIGAIDYIEHRKTALLVEPHNSEELKEALNYLIENPQKAKELGRKALESIREKFTIENFAQNIINLINSEVSA